jgi:hypothetical protein
MVDAMTQHADSHPDDRTPADDAAQWRRIERILRRKSFAVLSTVSAAGHPHAAGVVFDTVGRVIYVNTMRSSRKARNVFATGRAGVVLPVRRLPVGPPFTVQFQASAVTLDLDAPEIVAHLEAGRLKRVTSHGELDEPDGCFLRIEPVGRIHTYGIGVSTVGLVKDPLHAGGRSIAVPLAG